MDETLMYKISTEVKREYAIKHLFRISQKLEKLDNLEDVSKINDVIRILEQPHDTSQWKAYKLVDTGGRTVLVHECLNCHYAFRDIQNFRYCPNCGSFMVEQPERGGSE